MSAWERMKEEKYKVMNFINSANFKVERIWIEGDIYVLYCT